MSLILNNFDPIVQAAEVQSSLHISEIGLSHCCSTILIPFLEAGWNELSLFINGEVGTVWGKHSIFGVVYASSKNSNESAHCTG